MAKKPVCKICAHLAFKEGGFVYTLLVGANISEVLFWFSATFLQKKEYITWNHNFYSLLGSETPFPPKPPNFPKFGFSTEIVGLPCLSTKKTPLQIAEHRSTRVEQKKQHKKKKKKKKQTNQNIQKKNREQEEE